MKIPAADRLEEFYTLPVINRFIIYPLVNLDETIFNLISNERFKAEYGEIKTKEIRFNPTPYSVLTSHFRKNDDKKYESEKVMVVDYNQLAGVKLSEKDIKRFERPALLQIMRIEFERLVIGFVVSGNSIPEQKFRFKSIIARIERAIRVLSSNSRRTLLPLHKEVSLEYIRLLNRSRDMLFDYFSDIYSDLNNYTATTPSDNNEPGKVKVERDFDNDIFKSLDQSDQFQFMADNFVEDYYNDYSYLYYKLDAGKFKLRFDKQAQYYIWLEEKGYINEDELDIFIQKASLNKKSIENRTRESKYNKLLKKFSDNRK